MPLTSRKRVDIAAAAQPLPGFQTLQPVQREAVQWLVDGHDAVLLQPASSDTAAVYREAGAWRGGTTVVVSASSGSIQGGAQALQLAEPDPEGAGPAPSASGQPDLADRIEAGAMGCIFLSMEELKLDETIERLKKVSVPLIVIDEADSVSQWGHEFRPDYLRLGRFIEALDHPPVLATSTMGSNEVRVEIVNRLGLREPRVFIAGFDRHNISLRVDLFATKDEKYRSLLRRVEFADKPGIVYVSTHKNAESIATDLQQIGVPAVFYHGGMKAKEREEIESQFMIGDAPVIVATNSFGTGLHKPDIRFVYHADVSDSVDEYYRQIDLAGRDGEAAEAVLFYRPQDISTQSFKTVGAPVDLAPIEAVYTAIMGKKSPISRETLSAATGLNPRKLVGLIHKLEETGAIGIRENGDIEATSNRHLNEVVEDAEHRQQFQKDVRKRLLLQMQNYAECRRCRRECLLRNFGDVYSGPCGNCDRCEERGVLTKVA